MEDFIASYHLYFNDIKQHKFIDTKKYPTELVSYILDQNTDKNKIHDICIQYLIETINGSIHTLMTRACTINNLTVVKTLVEKYNYQKWPVIRNSVNIEEILADYFQIEIIDYLADKDKNDIVSVLYLASEKNNFELIKLLVNKFLYSKKELAQALAYSIIGDYGYCTTSDEPKINFVKYFLKHGADVSTNNLALKAACKINRDCLELVKYLIEHGADFTLNDYEVIKDVVENGDLELTQYFLEKVDKKVQIKYEAVHVDVEEYLKSRDQESNNKQESKNKQDSNNLEIIIKDVIKVYFKRTKVFKYMYESVLSETEKKELQEIMLKETTPMITFRRYFKMMKKNDLLADTEEMMKILYETKQFDKLNCIS